MVGYDIYVFVLCLIVFVLLVGMFGFMISLIIKLTTRLVKSGSMDTEIFNEYEETRIKREKRKSGTVVEKIVSGVVCVALLLVFAFSLYVNISEQSPSGTLPTIRVVKSASMSEKHDKNDYLEINNLHDQIQTFDLILTYKLPDEEDLELYDIVVYEVGNTLLVHRIVGIEEPNKNHSERWFLLQGDAVENPDRFPVRYSQMKGIYRGERIPFVGSFVAFMQSPAGWLCALLVVFVMIIMPFIEKKLNKVKYDRLLEAGLIVEADGKAKVEEEK